MLDLRPLKRFARLVYGRLAMFWFFPRTLSAAEGSSVPMALRLRSGSGRQAQGPGDELYSNQGRFFYPSFVTIGKSDFDPVAELVGNLNTQSFVKDEKLGSAFAG